MIKEQKMVEDFHKKYNCLCNSVPTLTDVNTRFLRSRLILEEAVEFMAAANQADMMQMADSLCDLFYVIYGTAVVLGLDLEPLFAEVQRSNMTKDGGQDAGGKVKKGVNFDPPKLMPLLKIQGWRQEKCTRCGTFLTPSDENDLCLECRESV